MNENGPPTPTAAEDPASLLSDHWQNAAMSYFTTVIEPIITKRPMMPDAVANPEECVTVCRILPNIGNMRFEHPDETEDRYEAVCQIFEDVCYLRQRRKSYTPGNDKDVKVLYKTRRSVVAQAAKSVPAVDLCPELVEQLTETRMDWKNAPDKFLQSLAIFLDHKTLLGCRLVCRRWNEVFISAPQFLDRILYLVDQSLSFVERCKTQVKWRHVNSHFFPSVETQAIVGYHQKYLVNKLNQSSKYVKNVGAGPANQQPRQFFLLNRVSTLVLTGVELNRDTFMKWLSTSSGALNSLELQSCILKPQNISRTSGLSQKNKNNQVLTESGGISSIKAQNLSLASLGEFLRLVKLVVVKNNALKVFEVGVRVPPPRSANDPLDPVRKSKLEAELTKLLQEIVGAHGKSLESLEICLTPLTSLSGIPQFFHGLGYAIAPSPSSSVPKLKNFGFRIITGNGAEGGIDLIRDPKQVGFTGPAEVDRTMENVVRVGSSTLKRINVPFWTIQGPQSLEMASSLSILLPKLSELGGQFDFLPRTSDTNWSSNSQSQPEFDDFDWDDLQNLQKSTSQDINENYKNLKAFKKIEQLAHSPGRGLTKLVMYASFCPAVLKRCFPWLKELELDYGGATGVTPTDFQGILKSFPKLVKLCVGIVKGFVDVTLMGVEPPVMQIMKEKSLARMRKEANNGNFGNGFPVSRIRKLRILRIRGEMDITDVGIIQSFGGMKELEVLELSGSILKISPTSLHFLAVNAPGLREIVMALSKDTVHEGVLADFLGKFPLLQNGRGRITVV